MDFLYELFLKLLAWIIIIAAVSMPIRIIIKYLKDEFNEFKFSKNDISSNEDFDSVFNKWEKDFEDNKGHKSYTSYSVNPENYDIDIDISIKTKSES